MGADIKSCLFPGLGDNDIKLLGHLFHHLFNTSGMDTTIIDKLQQSQTGNFTTNRVKSRQNYSFRGIVNNNINTCGRLYCSYITPFPTNNPAFHLIIGQGDHGYGFFSNIVSSVPGNSKGKNIFPLAVCLHFHLIFNADQPFGGIHSSLTFKRLHQHFLGFVLTDTGDLFQLIPLFSNNQVNLFAFFQ